MGAKGLVGLGEGVHRRCCCCRGGFPVLTLS